MTAAHTPLNLVADTDPRTHGKTPVSDVSRRRVSPQPKIEPILVDRDSACRILGGISRKQLGRIVESGQLPVVRLPGGRDRKGHGTSAPSRRPLYAIEDLRRLVRASTERVGVLLLAVTLSALAAWARLI